MDLGHANVAPESRTLKSLSSTTKGPRGAGVYKSRVLVGMKEEAAAAKDFVLLVDPPLGRPELSWAVLSSPRVV